MPPRPEPSPPERGDRAGGILPEGFHFGVATAGFQVEGGFNGPGEPGNNWLRWEQVGRVEPSGNAVGFWDRPEEALDRAAGLGCDSFRLGLEWARVEPRPGEVDDRALSGYRKIIDGCIQRGLEPLVTLHHFTHPSWLGEDFWLRPDSPERFLAWVEMVLAALAGRVRLWVTINEINVLAIESWLLGSFPPGRFLAFGDAAVAADHLLAAHVLAYQAIHRARPDAVVTTNNACVSVYDFDRRLTDMLMARRLGVARHELEGWIDERRAEHDAALPPSGPGERGFRRLGATASPFGRGSSRRSGPAGWRCSVTGRLMPSTPVPMSRPSMWSVSITTTRWRPGISGPPGTAPPVGAAGCRPGSCGTTSPIRAGSPGGWVSKPRRLPRPPSGWWRTGSATG